MEEYGNQIQSLMNEFYNEWQKDENRGKSKWDVLSELSEAHQMAVAFGNFNYQVENGGIHQWIYNGYFHDDAEKLTEYLENGTELDERCQKILDTIYKLDQNARDTDCESDGYFIDPDDEDSEQQFIGDMIDCDSFDTWYYAHCDGDGWWKTVCGVIEKVTGHEFVPALQENGEKGLAENSSITSVINGDLSVGDTVVSHSAGELSFLAGIVRSINKLGSPEHDTGNVGDDIYVDFSALEYSPRRVSEIEFAFRNAYGERREFDDLPLDEVIMGPDMLVRANNLDLTSRDEMYDILESDEGALEYCNRILSVHGLHISGLDADVAMVPQAEQAIELKVTNEEPITPLEQLKERLDQNLSDYFDSINKIEGVAITGFSSKIAVMAEAHHYLTEQHSFKTSELEYLLQFKNPLEVVADEFEAYSIPDDSRETEMWRIFDTQDAIHGDYELMPDADEPIPPESRNVISQHIEIQRLSQPVSPDLMADLRDRLDENFAEYKAETLRLGKEGLFYAAPEIAANLQSYYYFSNELALTTGQAEFLLKLQKPLELISDKWSDGIGGIEGAVTAIFHDQERTLNSGSYELASDDPETPATTVSAQEKTSRAVSTGEKPSVMDEIRQSQREAREHPPIAKDKSIDRAARKKSDPEL
jgi:hypothetical protein